MDTAHLAILGAGVALIFGGARLLWCGHRPDRRRSERRMTRRGPGRRLT